MVVGKTRIEKNWNFFSLGLFFFFTSLQQKSLTTKEARVWKLMACVFWILWRHLHNKNVISKTNQSLRCFCFQLTRTPWKKIVRSDAKIAITATRRALPGLLFRNALLRPFIVIYSRRDSWEIELPYIIFGNSWIYLLRLRSSTMLDEEAFVQSIPKIELHLHLDGSLSSGNFLLLFKLLL